MDGMQEEKSRRKSQNEVVEARRFCDADVSSWTENRIDPMCLRKSSADPISMGRQESLLIGSMLRDNTQLRCTTRIPVSAPQRKIAIKHALDKKAPFRHAHIRNGGCIDILASVKWVNDQKPDIAVL